MWSSFNCRMALGKRAKVTKVYKDGDVYVTISGQSWTLNPDLISAVSQVGTLTCNLHIYTNPNLVIF